MGTAERRNDLNREINKSARLVDRFGRPILEGCGYTVNFLQPPVYTVVEIVPVLDRPELPRGSFRVRLEAQLTVICHNGHPTEELALCSMPQSAAAALLAASKPEPVQTPPEAGTSTAAPADAPAEPSPEAPAETPESPVIPFPAPDAPEVP